MTSLLPSTFGGEEVKYESAGREPWARGREGGGAAGPQTGGEAGLEEPACPAAPALAACVPPGRAWGKAVGCHILSWTSRIVTPRVGGPPGHKPLRPSSAGRWGGRKEGVGEGAGLGILMT